MQTRKHYAWIQNVPKTSCVTSLFAMKLKKAASNAVSAQRCCEQQPALLVFLVNYFFLTFQLNLIGCICFVCFGGKSPHKWPPETDYSLASAPAGILSMLVITLDTFFFSFECWLSFVFSGFEPFCKQFMFLLWSNKSLKSALTSEQLSNCRKAQVVY